MHHRPLRPRRRGHVANVRLPAQGWRTRLGLRNKSSTLSSRKRLCSGPGPRLKLHRLDKHRLHGHKVHTPTQTAPHQPQHCCPQHDLRTWDRQAGTWGRQAANRPPNQRAASCSCHSGSRPLWVLLHAPHLHPADPQLALAASVPRGLQLPPRVLGPPLLQPTAVQLHLQASASSPPALLAPPPGQADRRETASERGARLQQGSPPGPRPG